MVEARHMNHDSSVNLLGLIVNIQTHVSLKLQLPAVLSIRSRWIAVRWLCLVPMLVAQEIALMPLERMLSVVRSRCAEIFRYTADLNQSGDAELDDGDGASSADADADSEFVLLEKDRGVEARGHRAPLDQPTDYDVNDELTEDEVMVLNWTQGENAVVIQQDRHLGRGLRERAPVVRDQTPDAPEPRLERHAEERGTLSGGARARSCGGAWSASP
ncbi:unnamed protein product [Prorocentrum cordatum]|uniref:Anaphase-promoting complex subunit 1 n=1 Tax=Prorocentrum cordatum TaxID=2364126 RepID=A0ABN9RJY0_9DINO|nr:unnamed protein product [Polarella glacialis]